MSQVFLTTASTSPFPFPGDFTVAGHTVQMVGAGGNGGTGTSGTSGTAGGGGGGGAFANLAYSSGTITPGSTTQPFLVAAGGTSTFTQWGSSSNGTGNGYAAAEGSAGAAAGGGGVGGSASTLGTPTIVYTLTGHTGGTGGSGGGVNTLGAGGGAGSAGPAANGGNGGTPTSTGGGGGGGGGAANVGGSPSTATGGTGGNGSTGTGGTGSGTSGTSGNPGTGSSGGGGGPGAATVNVAGAGGSGTDIDSAHGCGGGGGGSGSKITTGAATTITGGNGGAFGGGGGGVGCQRTAGGTLTAGTGGNGVIAVTYSSAVAMNYDRAYGAGKFAPIAHTIRRDYFQLPALDVQRETNPHFLGRFTAPVHARFRYNSSADSPIVATASWTTVVAFDDGYPSPASISKLYQKPSTDIFVAVAQPETNVSFLGRFTAPVHARFRYNLTNPDVPAAQDANAGWIVVLDPPQRPRVQAARLYYQGQAVDVPAAAAQPETQPHFIGRYSAPVHARFRYNAIFENPAAAPNFTGIFVVAFDDGYLSAPRIAPLYQLPAVDTPTVAAQAETQPHFIGRFTAPVHARFPYSTTWDSRVPQPETNTSFIGRFAAPAHAILPALRQNLPPAFAAETNSHFLGRFQAPTHALSPQLRFGSDPNVPPAVVVETNTNFLGRFAATAHTISPALRQNFPSAGAAETNVSFIGRFSPPTHALTPIVRQNAATDVPAVTAQAETNVGFLGRFTAPTHARFRYNFAAADPIAPASYISTIVVTFDDGYPAPPRIAPLYQQPAGDVPTVVAQPETNPHFLGTFEAYTHSLLTGVRQGSADVVVPAVETNPHFLGRFAPTVFTLPPTLRQNSASEAATAAIPPDQRSSTFVVNFDDGYLSPARIAATYWGQATDFIVATPPAETSVSFIGRFTAPTHARFNYNTRADAQPVLETNVHFLGRFTPAAHQILRGLRETTLSADTQRETNPHFVGRYTAPVHAIFRYNTVWDSRVPQPETNPHFLGRFGPAIHTINRPAFQNPASDFIIAPQPTTNIYFLGRFVAPVHARFAYNTWDTRVPQVETNPHTIGRHTPAKITVLPALRQAPAQDLAPETNTHFLGRHVPPAHRINQAARQNPALDIQRPEQNPHFVGRFAPPTHQILRSLLGNLGGDRIIVPNVETQPHFIGRHTPTVHARSIYHLERQGVTLVQVAEAKSILAGFVASTALAGQGATSTLAAYRAISDLDRNR